ncbi:diguanylate cyclase domain-containing protein [Actinoplanes sp. NPDC020271]|uniref:diguanylate cyclase domain-containing protein n=1 Tax=Actinoplanes sp. NPDC020271 TaxID=3363896 RepID=UPI003794D902
MRTETVQREAAALDDTLLSRRRMVEAAALVARFIGMVVTPLYGLGDSGIGPTTVDPVLTAACMSGTAVMAAASVLSVLGLRRPGSRWYTRLSVLQVVLDTLALVLFVTFSERYTSQPTWPLLSLSIAIAAIRHQLPGALAIWAITSASLLAMPLDPGELPGATCLNIMIAVITGAQASAFQRQLTMLQQVRRELQHQASHDNLTGLPNRARLADCAEQWTSRRLAVLLLDLNGFKQVNDGHGHAAGDALLHRVAQRLTAVIGPDDVAGRLGGDEFMVLLPDAGAQAAAEVGERIREAVARPVPISDGREVTVGVSIGVALRPAGGRADLDMLTAEADAAMYREKHAGRAA